MEPENASARPPEQLVEGSASGSEEEGVVGSAEDILLLEEEGVWRMAGVGLACFLVRGA